MDGHALTAARSRANPRRPTSPVFDVFVWPLDFWPSQTKGRGAGTRVCTVNRPGVRLPRGRAAVLVSVISVGLTAAAAGMTVAFGASPTASAIVAVVVLVMAAGIGTLIADSLRRRVGTDVEQRELQAPAPPLIRDVTAQRARVHPSVRDDVEYVERDAEIQVLKQLRLCRKVLIVGPPMAGKTRMALSVAKRSYGDCRFYEPRNGDSLHELWATGAKFGRVVVWLDDLERFVSRAELTGADLSALEDDDAVVIATIRTSEYEKLQPNRDLKPPGWDAVAWFGDPVWLVRWSDAEFDRLAKTRAGPAVMHEARQYGLSDYLGGAPRLREKLRTGEADSSPGYAVVRACGDWRRAGMQTPVALETLVAILPAYLRPLHTISIPEQAREGVGWATAPVSNTVSLLSESEAGYRVPDLVLEYFADLDYGIPDALWSAVLRAASPTDLLDVGASSYFLGRLDVTERALRTLLNTNKESSTVQPDIRAMAGYNLGVALGHLGRSEDAIKVYDQVATEYGTDPEPAIREVVAQALVNKGALLKAKGDLDN